MKDIVIIGAGGFGRELKGLIDQINVDKPVFNFLGYYDDGKEKGVLINGFPLLGNLLDLNQVKKELAIVIGIGDPKLKYEIVSQLTNSCFYFPTLIHPSAVIGDEFVSIGKGVLVCAGTIITCNVEISDFVTFNLMCSVGHDTKIKSYSSFMPAVNVSGEVEIEEGVYVGTGAKIINQLSIGKGTIIGAGAVVSKSLPANCTAVGIPAKPIKFH